MSAPLTGQCLCGAVRVTVAAHPGWVGACHCRMCRRWSGGLFLCFPADGVTVAGPAVVHASSAFAERAFCGTCGSHLWIRNRDAAAGHYELMPGLFDQAAEWPLLSEVYSDCAIAAVRGLPAERRATRAEYESKHLHVTGDAP